ncbi:MAG TPA: AAA family ATPase, partial [Terriglobales bacterium]
VDFGTTGLTVVYGDNGAGKSSYARVLKRACRARGSDEPILPNAFSDSPAGPPTAEITFAVGDVEKKHLWRDGQPTAAELTSVSVFDSSSAQVYVTDKTEVAFRPFGLDVLDRLASTCADVRSRLEKELTALRGQAFTWPALPESSAAARLLKSLSALTKPEHVDRVTRLSDAEMAELEHLRAVLLAARSEDPVKRSRELRVKADRIRNLTEQLKAIDQALAEDAIRLVDETRRAAADAQAAADLAKDSFEHGAQLPGVGSGVWRKLWEAARAYSQADVYPAKEFPYVEDGARCVLCHQDLAADARERLCLFERFVQGKVQRDARVAADQLHAARTRIEAVRIEIDPHLLDELKTSSPEVAMRVSAFLNAAATCRSALLAALRTDSVLCASRQSAPVAELEEVVKAVQARAEDLARAADPEARRLAEERVSELDARLRLAELRPLIDSEIARLARVNAYDRALKDTATTNITRQSTELTKTHVTDALAAGFESELKKFGFTYPELVLKPAGGQKGALRHQVQLKYATRAQVGKIMSEGESRCLALAAFLAEVRSGENSSAIVFDDPVSSLDHRWRSRMADRLVSESTERQVIVFTHELVFLYELVKAAERQSIPCASRTVVRVRAVAGRVEPELPWDALSTRKRIGVLRDSLQRARKVLRNEGEQGYELRATWIYARLRRTWERAVEEVLLNGVVERFRDSVQTQKLKKVADLSNEDFETVEAGMAKSSKWEGGHDHALAMNEPVPRPDELEADIA